MEITPYSLVFSMGFKNSLKSKLQNGEGRKKHVELHEVSDFGAVGAPIRSPSFLKGLPFSTNCSP